ncbi:type II toxin-antitoxin system RelE/ParE family toxin [Marinilabilia sp.]|uniref:type II toxin-antitoxin system RelE/ParE family toxin n=1 Tax=Marinilabilia sp. TaxID=2021252 RepID=UPI0025C62515|nr:type II toxin-antitoxin system RelE/ParE family toxin [Marinilabilia sp.]
MAEKEVPKKIAISKEFLIDLDDIYQHGQYVFGDNQAAKYEDEIWMLIEKLPENYLIFPECRYLRTKSRMYRWIILDAHLVIYRITQKEIQLLRILHSKRSISKIKTSRKITP